MRMLAAALLATVLPALPATAQTDAPAGQQQFETLWLGSAWYPEQWPEERREEDLRLMKAHGANVVRIGEYAWSRMEPEEGKYDLDWLVRAVRLAAKYDIKVGTPSDAPPAWVAWLKARYGTLDKLNDAWTTQYWSQVYSAWEQVPFSSDKANGWLDGKPAAISRRVGGGGSAMWSSRG